MSLNYLFIYFSTANLLQRRLKKIMHGSISKELASLEKNLWGPAMVTWWKPSQAAARSPQQLTHPLKVTPVQFPWLFCSDLFAHISVRNHFHSGMPGYCTELCNLSRRGLDPTFQGVYALTCFLLPAVMPWNS